MPRLVYRAPELLAPEHERLDALFRAARALARAHWVDLDRNFVAAHAPYRPADARLEERAAIARHEQLDRLREDSVSAAGVQCVRISV